MKVKDNSLFGDILFYESSIDRMNVVLYDRNEFIRQVEHFMNNKVEGEETLLKTYFPIFGGTRIDVVAIDKGDLVTESKSNFAVVRFKGENPPDIFRLDLHDWVCNELRYSSNKFVTISDTLLRLIKSIFSGTGVGSFRFLDASEKFISRIGKDTEIVTLKSDVIEESISFMRNNDLMDVSIPLGKGDFFIGIDECKRFGDRIGVGIYMYENRVTRLICLRVIQLDKNSDEKLSKLVYDSVNDMLDCDVLLV